LDSDFDIISDRLTNIILNDEGPNMKTGFDREPRSQVDLNCPPAEITLEQVLPDVVNILTNPVRPRRHLLSTGPPLTPIERKQLNKEHSQHTVRVHNIFNRIDKQITALSEELVLFKETPSLDAFDTIQSKFSAIQESVERQKRDVPSLKDKKERLVSRLKALNDSIQEVRALLATEEEGPRKVSNGELATCSSLF
jgi:hypothetical protein